MKRTIFLIIGFLMIWSCVTLSFANGFNVSISSGASSIKVGDIVTLTATISNAVNATSGSIAVDFGNNFELVSGEFLKNGAMLSTFDAATKKGAIAYSATTNFEGQYFKLVLKCKTVSKEAQIIKVSVELKNGAVSIGSASGSKAITVGCATHSFEKWESISDTQHSHICKNCGKIENINHTWNAGKVTKQATCKETGTKIFTCTECGAIKTEIVEKLTTHTFDVWKKISSTQHSRVCSTCGKFETKEHAWNSGSITKQATCKEAGTKTFICTECGATKTETVEKLTTHTFDAWKKISSTQHSRVCTICEKIETEEHKWNSGSVTKKASCKEDGIKTFTCLECEAIKTEVIHSSNNLHVWDNGIVTKEATIEQYGEKAYTCMVCGSVKTEKVPPIGKSTPVPTKTLERTEEPTTTQEPFVTNEPLLTEEPKNTEMPMNTVLPMPTEEAEENRDSNKIKPITVWIIGGGILFCAIILVIALMIVRKKKK